MYLRRNLFQCTSILVSDRFCLLGHATGFVAPLFSKRLYTSFASVSVLANLLVEASQTQDFAASKFQSLEDLTLASLIQRFCQEKIKYSSLLLTLEKSIPQKG